MFDPERDQDPTRGRFYLRLLVVVVISAAGCVAMWPSVSGFSAGPDHNTGCLAITDGWHAERSGPKWSDLTFPAMPTEAERADPVAMARWRAEWQASQQRPEVQQANDLIAWQEGPGACIPKSRHRLLLTGIGLLSLGAFVGGIALVLRTRTNLRRSPELTSGA